MNVKWLRALVIAIGMEIRLAESLLLTKLKKMQEECGLELNPTYAFARVYTYLATIR
jgi:hypothetical protein